MTNDTLGHSIGDKLLQAVSNRLLIATNDFDTVARLAVMNLLFFCRILNTEHKPSILHEEILHLIERPFQSGATQFKNHRKYRY